MKFLILHVHGEGYTPYWVNLPTHRVGDEVNIPAVVKKLDINFCPEDGEDIEVIRVPDENKFKELV